MDAFNDELDFSISTDENKLVNIEIELKSKTRKNSLNIPVIKDIERYTDKYAKGLQPTKNEVIDYIDLELLSPELIKAFGESRVKNVEDIKDVDLEEESENIDEEIEENSEEAHDDYMEIFDNEESDFVEEKADEGFF